MEKSVTIYYMSTIPTEKYYKTVSVYISNDSGCCLFSDSFTESISEQDYVQGVSELKRNSAFIHDEIKFTHIYSHQFVTRE